jgi:hypothetical protein
VFRGPTSWSLKRTPTNVRSCHSDWGSRCWLVISVFSVTEFLVTFLQRCWKCVTCDLNPEILFLFRSSPPSPGVRLLDLFRLIQVTWEHSLLKPPATSYGAIFNICLVIANSPYESTVQWPINCNMRSCSLYDGCRGTEITTISFSLQSSRTADLLIWLLWLSSINRTWLSDSAVVTGRRSNSQTMEGLSLAAVDCAQRSIAFHK